MWIREEGQDKQRAHKKKMDEVTCIVYCNRQLQSSPYYIIYLLVFFSCQPMPTYSNFDLYWKSAETVIS